MKAIVPFRGFKNGKSRLRVHLNHDLVRQLLEQMLSNTILVLHELNIVPIIVTADKEIQKKWEKEIIIFDSGNSLRDAISLAINKIEKDGEILFVMPDLPLIDLPSLKCFYDIDSKRKVVPALDGGITVAYGEAGWINRIPFGMDSFRKLKEMDPTVTVYRNEILGFDLDTIEDYLQYKNTLKVS